MKYIELAQNLGQETYMFDARNGIDNNNLVKILEYLILHKDEEKNKIKENVIRIQKENIFNTLWSYLDE